MGYGESGCAAVNYRNILSQVATTIWSRRSGSGVIDNCWRGRSSGPRPGPPMSPPWVRAAVPRLCVPTGDIAAPEAVIDHRGERTAVMPKRRRTRTQNRAHRIAAERRHMRQTRPGPTCPDGQLLRRTPTHQRRRAATLLMQSMGALADETSQEIGGSCANTRGIRTSCRRRRRPIRSVHAAAAQQAERNSKTCSPARRQFRRRAIRRSRVGVGGRSADVRHRPYARRGTVRVLRGRT